MERKSKPQLRELLTNYGPVGLVWFDRGLYTPEQAQDFVQLVRGIQPDCLINGRVGHYEQELVGDYQNAVTSGKTVKRFNRRGQFHISKWTGPADQASWRVRFLQPGRYRVRLEGAGAPGRPTGTFVLSAGDREVQVESPQASEWYQYVSLDAGVLDIAAAGEQDLVLRPARELGQDLMCCKSLKLERVP
jgi:hypothetical protein